MVPPGQNPPLSSDPLAAQADAEYESGKSSARKAAEDLRAAASTKATEIRGKAEAKANELRGMAESKAHQYRGKAEVAMEEAKLKARGYQSDGESYIRDNPSQSILSALAIGFVLGLIFRR